MTITITNNAQSRPQNAVVQLSGRLDAFNAPEVRAQLDEAISNGILHFVLDLRTIKFLDSSGLAVLVSLLKRVRLDGGDVQMVMPDLEAARRILRLTRFDKVFTIVETPEEAFQNS